MCVGLLVGCQVQKGFVNLDASVGEARSNTATSLAFQYCAGLARLKDVRPDFLHDDLIWSG